MSIKQQWNTKVKGYASSKSKASQSGWGKVHHVGTIIFIHLFLLITKIVQVNILLVYLFGFIQFSFVFKLEFSPFHHWYFQSWTYHFISHVIFLKKIISDLKNNSHTAQACLNMHINIFNNFALFLGKFNFNQTGPLKCRYYWPNYLAIICV